MNTIAHRREAAAAGRLELERCTACGAVSAAPRGFCAVCGGSVAPFVAAGPGRIAAITVIHRAPTADYRPLVPYAIALADLAEGVRLMGQAPLDAAVGDQVVAEIRPLAGRDLVFFASQGDPAP